MPEKICLTIFADLIRADGSERSYVARKMINKPPKRGDTINLGGQRFTILIAQLADETDDWEAMLRFECSEPGHYAEMRKLLRDCGFHLLGTSIPADAFNDPDDLSIM